MRRGPSIVAGLALVALAVLSVAAAAQQPGPQPALTQEEMAAEFARLWLQLPQATDPGDLIALAERALKLEPEVRQWPFQVAREEVRATLLGWLGDGSADIFRFDAATDSGITRATRDVIYQFEDALDKLEFSTLFDFNRVTALTQTPGSTGHFLNTNVAFDGTIGAIHAVQLGGQTIVELDTNGDKIADFSVALDGVHALTSANFLFDV